LRIQLGATPARKASTDDTVVPRPPVKQTMKVTSLVARATTDPSE